MAAKGPRANNGFGKYERAVVKHGDPRGLPCIAMLPVDSTATIDAEFSFAKSNRMGCLDPRSRQDALFSMEYSADWPRVKWSQEFLGQGRSDTL